MNDALSQSLTAFDALALTLIILSALMALARGFMRELATLGAFIAAVAAAYYGRLYLRDMLAEWLPEGSPSWTADAIVVSTAFVVAYVAVAWIGGRIARNIRGLEGVGVVDRVAGLGFGAARGVVALVFTALLVGQAVDEEELPGWIAESRLYPYFSAWAGAVNEAAPSVVRESASISLGEHA